MDSELVRLQWITLGSIGVLVLLCAGLLLVVWMALNFSQLIERTRATLGRFGSRESDVGSPAVSPPGQAIDDTVEYAALFRQPLRAGDEVDVIQELNWQHGTGTVVPVGEVLRLVGACQTTSGVRWSARWRGHYLSFIPPEYIRLHPTWPMPGHQSNMECV